MPKVAENIQIYGGDSDAVFTAPFGSTGVTLPTGLTVPAAPLSDVGWLSEDGLSWDDTYDKVTIVGHQGGVEVIEVFTKTAREFKFQCLETTARQLSLRYPGWTPVASGVAPNQFYGGEVPAPVADIRPWVVDAYSISNPVKGQLRRVVPRGQVNNVGTLIAKRGQVSIFEYTVKVLEGKFFIYGDSAALAAANL